MSDLIERSQALNAINIATSVSGAWDNVSRLPSAQVERKHGRWLIETRHYKDYIDKKTDDLRRELYRLVGENND